MYFNIMNRSRLKATCAGTKISQLQSLHRPLQEFFASLGFKVSIILPDQVFDFVFFCDGPHAEIIGWFLTMKLIFIKAKLLMVSTP